MQNLDINQLIELHRCDIYQIKNIECLLPSKRFLSIHSVPFSWGMEVETGGMMDGIFSGSSGHCDNTQVHTPLSSSGYYDSVSQSIARESVGARSYT